MKWQHFLSTGILCAAVTFGLVSCVNVQGADGAAGTPGLNGNKASAIQTSDLFSPAGIRSVTNGVADWQLGHMEEFEDYIPSFQDRSREKRGWIQGTFLKGLSDWAATTDNDAYFDYLKNFAENEGFRLEDRIYHADDHVVGQYYFVLYDRYGDRGMIQPTQDVFDAVLANPSTVSLDFGPKGTEKGYYKECLKRWCWADALFMSPPVWTRMTEVTGDPKYLEFSDKEFWATTDYLFDTEANLFLRDSRFFERREENGKKIYWSRGNGWVFAGLADILEALPTDHPSYPRYVKLYKDMAKKLITLQADNGYWPVSLDAGELYPVAESSGTAFFVAGLSWGVAQGHLDAETYLPSIKKGWVALNEAVNDEGMIGWVQQVGYAPDKVAANETQFYGSGAFLLAGTELLKLSEAGMIETNTGAAR